MTAKHILKTMENKRLKIRTRVMGVISFMLFTTFFLIGIIFNIAARQYIQSNAIAQLNRSFNAIHEAMEIAETILLEFPRGLPGDRSVSFALRRNEFRIESNMFVLDRTYNLIGNQIISDSSMEIHDAIRNEHINLDGMRNRMMNTAGGTYYISSYHLPIIHTDESAYWIIYADITGLLNFAYTINRFLILLFCALYIVAVFLAFFFSNTITQPIQKLCMLAMNIGRGDFSPKDYKFRDKEFEDLNMALNKSARQLGVYDNEQKAFFQNVSHELRTPLMSIQCYAEGISCGLMEPKNASETILSESARLNEMVKDLLYISKIDNITSAYTVTNTDLKKLIQECAGRQQAVAEKRNLRFSLILNEVPVIANCAAELITRAIENLISNAIQYAKSEITISCNKTSETIEICVKDDGDGIGAEIMPHIFERFYKGDDGNHGIGLSIVKSIIEQHGGTVNAENATDGGAVFTISIPNKSIG